MQFRYNERCREYREATGLTAFTVHRKRIFNRRPHTKAIEYGTKHLVVVDAVDQCNIQDDLITNGL